MKHHNTTYLRVVALILFIVALSAVVPYAVFAGTIQRALSEDVKQQLLCTLDSVVSYLDSHELPISDVEKLFVKNTMELHFLHELPAIPLNDAQRHALETDRAVVFVNAQSARGRGGIAVLRYGADYITARLDLHPLFHMTHRAGVLSLLFSLVLAILASAAVGHRVLRPVRKLSLATQKVAAGDFSLQIPNPNPLDELGILINNFNIMTRELSSVELLRSDFVSDISHEFKTPLTAIEGYTRLLADEPDPEARREYVQVITEETRRLSTLAQNVLMLNKLEKDSIPAHKAPVCIDEQIRRALTLLEPKWAAKNLRLELELDEVTMQGYESLLSQVWANLLDNAVKFSPDGGCVAVSLTASEGKLCFCVYDEGAGIAAEDRKHLFDKFYQADKSRGGDGNGLGLSIALRVVQMHGGDITVQNRTEGGTAFIVTLPAPLV